MKKNYIIIATVLCVLLTSCANTYHFCQVYETKSLNQDGLIKSGNNELRYENSQCVICYNFWSNGGTANFEFYNKTDEIIYIDLSKSFFVLNGEAHDIFRNREWSQGSTMGVASAMAYGYGISRSAALSVGLIEPSIISDDLVAANAKASRSKSANVVSTKAVARSESSTITIKEKQIVAVPPHSRKYIKTYSITTSPLLSCDLQRFPSRKARIDYTAENTPFRFSDIITYNVGENIQPITVNNEFYVSSVTNYAEPEIIVMKQREEPCENMRTPDYVTPEYNLYDKYMCDSICEFSSSFYSTYSITTNKKLYDGNDNNSYSYDTYYQAYTKSKSNSSMSAAVGITGIIITGIMLIGLAVSNIVK